MYLAFEAIRSRTDEAVPAKVIANFVMGPHARELKSVGANALGTAGPSAPGEIARLLEAIQAGSVSRQIGRELLDEHLSSGASATELLAGGAPSPMGDDETLLGLVDAAIADNPKAVADYRAGKPVIGFLVGRVMQASAGAADAARVKTLLGERLDRGD
jgi:aspartyl-tRNA(Asn)/glutamyl-tRNA(Gln) amidotransferase subunit B